MNIQDIIIKTPMEVEVSDTLRHWTICGFTGGLIYGEARLGKTYAVRQSAKNISASSGGTIKVFRLSVGSRDNKTVKSIFLRICRSVGRSEIPRSTTSDELSDSLVLSFLDAATSNERRQVVIIVDECQELTIEQIDVFAELYNELDDIGVRLSVYFIANSHKFKNTYEELSTKENRYLKERFFHNSYNFQGIRTLKDLKSCLIQYDNVITPNDGKSLLEYYCPEMIREGIKISDLSNNIWEVYQDNYAVPLRISSWGMTYFTRVMSIFISDYLSHYWVNDNSTINEMVDKSIAASGLAPNTIDFSS